MRSPDVYACITFSKAGEGGRLLKSVNMPLDKVMDTLLPGGMQSIFYFVMSPWLLTVCQPPPEVLMTVMCHCCCSRGTCKTPRTLPLVKLDSSLLCGFSH